MEKIDLTNAIQESISRFTQNRIGAKPPIFVSDSQSHDYLTLTCENSSCRRLRQVGSIPESSFRLGIYLTASAAACCSTGQYMRYPRLPAVDKQYSAEKICGTQAPVNLKFIKI